MTRAGLRPELPVAGARGRGWRVGSNPGPDIGGDKCRSLHVSATPRDGDVVSSLRDGRGRLNRARLDPLVAIDLAAIRDDGLPSAGHVAVTVGIASGVVGHSHGLEIHVERTLAIVRQTTSPVYHPC